MTQAPLEIERCRKRYKRHGLWKYVGTITLDHRLEPVKTVVIPETSYW